MRTKLVEEQIFSVVGLCDNKLLAYSAHTLKDPLKINA
jgi:hypothetical protein